MNIFEVAALEKSVTATIEIPGSKSYTNRALVMAALTKGPVTLYNPLYSEDTEAMIDCLRTLGLKIETFPDRTIVYDDISIIQNRSYELFAKDSGTTVRFLLALLCLTSGTKVIKGNARLNERPIKDLVAALRLLGGKIDYCEKEGQLPLKIHSSALRLGSEVTIEASMSSQFFSALLMIAPFLNGLKIRFLGELISKPYVDMTIHAMREWGVDVLEMGDGGYHIPCGQSYQKNQYVVEGDFSSAGYFFAIAALTGSTITLKNLNPHSIQADCKFLNILARMGNEINIIDHGITIIGKQILPQSINMEDYPDQVQTMAVLTAFARGVTKISGVRSLRLKETERVQALKNELAKMGIKTDDTHDTLTIYGGTPHAAIIDTYGDHRMAMAFAVAGTKLPGMKIRHPEVVNKTFPTFWDKLGSL
jgi:3-phosphoshikimate 1-carboxyvinyltransferase